MLSFGLGRIKHRHTYIYLYIKIKCYHINYDEYFFFFEIKYEIINKLKFYSKNQIFAFR